MGLEAFFPLLKRKKMFNEGPALYEYAICQCPPIHFKGANSHIAAFIVKISVA